MKQAGMVEKIESPASTRNREPIFNALKKIIKKNEKKNLSAIVTVKIQGLN